MTIPFGIRRTRSHPVQWNLTPPAWFWLWLPMAAGCATPPPVELRVDAARVAIEGRSSSVLVESAFGEVIQAMPKSALLLPSEADRRSPSQAGYWQVRALAFAPAVRRARRAHRAARGAAMSAGAPAPVAIQAVDHELGGDDKLVEAIGVLDLIGLLGLGPSRAERGVAAAQERLALGQLESQAFGASIAVEAARIRTVAARARLASLEALAEDASLDLGRVRILAENDRVSDASAALARAEVARIQRNASMAREALEAARLNLARASGVPSTGTQGAEVPLGSAAPGADLGEVGALGLDELLTPREDLFEGIGWFEATEAIETHPRLREARLAFGVAELEVRAAASRAWPGIGLGPHLGYLDQARIGAVLRLALPFPSSWRGLLEAAVERRDRAIEAYEEALLDLMNRESEASLRGREIIDRAAHVTPQAAEPAVAHWRAARALFRNSRASVGEWTRALNHLADTVTWRIDDAELAALAALDLVSARGPLAMGMLFDGAPRGEVQP